MRKKGMIEVQFNWIFILVAGTLILLFFFKIVADQKTFADQKLATKILNELTVLLAGAEVATDVSEPVAIGGNKIDFVCSDVCSCNIKLPNLGVSAPPQSYDNQVIFAPEHIRGSQMIHWAVDWNMPYKVTNYLYITSPRYKYVILTPQGSVNPPFLTETIQKMPDVINDGKMGDFVDTLDGLDTSFFENDYGIRLVYYDEGLQYQSDLTEITNSEKIETFASDISEFITDNQLTLLIIQPDSGTGDTVGTLHFLTYDKDTGEFIADELKTTYYLGRASLIGAILSDRYYNYVCPMEAAYKRLGHISEIYSQRLDRLQTDGPPHCAGIYSSAESHLSSISSIAEYYFSELDQTQLISLQQSALEQLQRQNIRAFQTSCPSIY